MVVAIQLNRGIAAAGHTHGGLVNSSLDVHILERDLDLIVLIFGLDGHGVGRSGVRFLICDDGVLVAVGGLLVLGDVVAVLTCRNRNVAILNIVGICKGGEGRPGQQGGSQDKRRCPLRGRTG